MEELSQRFVDALHRLHADSHVEPLVALFDTGATLSKLGDRHEATGPDGARAFWLDYRRVFGDIEATFTATITGSGAAALEWTSSGTLHSGRPFTCAGISVLEGSGQTLSGFRTYYDSAAFVSEARA